jgi:hypothetical protein
MNIKELEWEVAEWTYTTPVEGSFEHVNEYSGSMKWAEIIHKMNDYQHP